MGNQDKGGRISQQTLRARQILHVKDLSGNIPVSFAFIRNYTKLLPNLLFQSFPLSFKRTVGQTKIALLLSRDPRLPDSTSRP